MPSETSGPPNRAAAPEHPPPIESTLEEITPVHELAARAAAGDGNALGDLYERYFDLVYRFLHLRTGHHADAENLAQDTWVRVARSIRTYEPRAEATFGTWVMRIAQNLLIDHYRSRSRKPEVPTADMLALDEPSLAVDPQDAAERHDQAQQIVAMLRRLTAAQRECVIYRFYIGLSVGETADAMGRQETAVKKLQMRALKVLRKNVRIELSAARSMTGPRDLTAIASVATEVSGV